MITMPVIRLVGVLLISATLCVAADLELEYRVRVPRRHASKETANTPTGGSERDRYKEDHEAFWWNCVMVKAQRLEAQCPIVCSGTPASSDGCRDGAMSAERQIAGLTKEHGAKKVQAYLRSFSSTPAAKEAFAKGRFHGEAVPEPSPGTPKP
jgi:hypothetical protein